MGLEVSITWAWIDTMNGQESEKNVFYDLQIFIDMSPQPLGLGMAFLMLLEGPYFFYYIIVKNVCKNSLDSW